jgi:tetratricopeptide (TPR) repeat protein
MVQAINIDMKTGLEFYQKRNLKEAYTVFFQLYEKSPSSRYCFYLGNVSYMMGKYDEAENWYRKGMELGERVSDNYYFNLGAVLIKQKKFYLSIPVLERIQSKTPLIRIVLSVLYYNEGNDPASERHIKALIQEVKAMPDEFLVSVYENYFFVSLRQNKLYQALSIGNLLRNFQDTSFAFWENYAGVLYKTSQLTDSQEILVKLLDMEKKKREQTYFKLLYLLIHGKKEFKEAVKYIDRALETEPENRRFLKLRAYLFHLMGDDKTAWFSMQKIEPSGREEYKMKALIAYKAEEKDAAVRTLESAFLIYSSDIQIFRNLISLYVQEKKYKQARLWIDLYHQKNGSDEFLPWLFQIALMEENFQGAREFGERILKKDTEEAYYFYYNMGKIYEKRGELDKAVELYEKTRNMVPDFPYPYVALAGIRVARGEYEQAINDYLITIQLLPEYGIYYYQLAQVYSLSSKYFLAREVLKQAIYREFPKQIIAQDPLFEPVFQKFPDFGKQFFGF